MQRAQKRVERGVSWKAESLSTGREWRERGLREDVPAKRTWKRTCVRDARGSRSARGLRSGRGLRGTRVEKRTLYERHVLARHERREEREAHVAREAHVLARHEFGAVVLWVDALQGSRDSFSLFIWVYVQMLVEAHVGDIVESFKCCRVFAFIRIFFCIVFVACT